MLSRRSLRRRPSLESLESRHALAGNVFAVLTEGTLTILGDEASNGVNIVYDVATKQHRISGTEAGGSATTINGAASPAAFSGVKHVQVRLGAGDDKLDFGAADQVYTAIGKGKLSIEMGSGNDIVELGRAGNDPSVGTNVAHRIYVNQGIWINLGDGNDQLDVANLKTNKSLIVLAGSGNDVIDFPTEFTPTGATSPQMFSVNIKGNLHIQLGEGDDDLTVWHVRVGQHLKVIDPTGPSMVCIVDVGVNEKVQINTGNDGDFVKLDYVVADELQLHTNGGNDDVSINHTRFKRMNIRTGSGLDDLTLRNSRTSYVTYIDGGGGGADFAGSGNSLRGLVRRNLG
jgi:hypothetical protein